MRGSVIDIYSDGGARGNPGPAASAFVVLEDNKILHQEKKFLGSQTNNVAEYSAVLMALTWLSKQNNTFQKVNYYLDSELVVRQLNGIYKIKNEHLAKMAIEIKALEKNINSKIYFFHVTRDKNKFADKLVNESIDENL